MLSGEIDNAAIKALLRRPVTIPVENLQTVLDRVEKETIEAAILTCNGNKDKVADILGLSPTTLWRKMRRLGIPWP